MNLKIYLLLLFPLFSLAACSEYPPFEKNDWGELELHGKVKTLKKTKYIYHYNKEEDVLKKIDTLVKRTGYIAEEKIRYPEKNNAVSNRNMIVLPIQIRRLQQISSTESNSSLDTTIRDKVNQATRESRTSKLTDTEVAIMASVGLDSTLSELLSPRSDNQMSKTKMNELIREKGTFKLEELPKTPKSRNSVLYLDALYKAMNIATDLVDDINDIS